MKPQPDRRSGSDRRTTTATAGWLSEDVRITRGFLLAVLIVTFSFFGFGTWAAVQTVSSLRDVDCRDRNRNLQDVRNIAHDLVDNDRFLISVADNLSPEGLPAEFTEPLEQRWAEQDAEIEAIYAEVECP